MGESGENKIGELERIREERMERIGEKRVERI